MPDRSDTAWTDLCSRLEQSSRDLMEEVRTYPTPIARCDEQLTQAIEARDAAFRHLHRASELERLRAGGARSRWRARVRAFAAAVEATASEDVAAACRRLVAALER